MITDERVLQPEFLPREVKHRDAEVSHLSSALRPLAKGGVPENTFIHGPTGTGKTCTAKFVARQLQNEVGDLHVQHVNCWRDHTRFKTLYRLLDGVTKTFDIHRRSTPKDVLMERLRDFDGAHYVAILDEVDQLDDKELLYDLRRIPGFTMILIANSEEAVFGQIDDRLRSRLSGCQRIRYQRYRLHELVGIIEDRVRWGLREDCVSTECIEHIADQAAGDARTAIGVLRNAARRATQQGMDEIQVELVNEVVPETKTEIRQRSTDKLTEHQSVLLGICKESGKIAPGDLYGKYTERVEDPKSNRQVRNYLSKLVQYDLIEADGETRGRTYQAVGS